ncbi:MAG: carboxy terminal-processing peptidase [Flavipsychrobacter sp.]|nr:carboxy terminal-processing peptidase [Flavipsychrobacter sp.]
MKNKILIPLLVMSALAAFFSFRYTGDANSVDDKRKLVIKTVLKAISQNHYSPRQMDDSFSSAAFNKILNAMDYDKRVLTQNDINSFKKYEFILDDGEGENVVSFFNDFNTIYKKRIDEAEAYYNNALKKPVNFNTEETINLNGEKIPFATDANELQRRWDTYIKYRMLAKYVEIKDDQKKRIEKKDTTLKMVYTNQQIDSVSRVSIKKNLDFYFKRMRKLKDDDRFTFFVNSMAGTHDPHTDFFPPVDKALFDEQMSGTFFGIGAQLRDEDSKVKIVQIIPGSPCWKQGELKAGDEILKVAQGTAEPVDVQGYDIDDVVKIIRGPRGTEVRLTVRQVSGAIKVIPIIRGIVEKEETFAKSAIINSGKDKIGYIYLPEFYADFQQINGRRCAEDVAIEVAKLKNADVNAIILDLRGNGGGSLNDVVSMGGLFIDKGPIVQVKTNGNNATQLDDPQSGTLYDGPLAIMVNVASASASEILAAAMQDYKRAVIVGSTTFGKGTVQKVISMDEYNSWLASIAAGKRIVSPDTIGSLKLTIQKFYRINGGSTQLKGVTPDIILPDAYEHIDIGERRDKAAMKWDEIPAVKYNVSENPLNIKELAARSKKRVETNPSFGLIKESAERIKKLESDNIVSLNETQYRKEQEEANTVSKRMEELEKKLTTLNISNLQEDLAKINIDSSNIKKNEDWLKALKKDIHLSETVNIVNDMIKSDMRVNLGTGMR